MTTFAEDIERAADGESIVAIVVGDEEWDYEDECDRGPSAMQPLIPKTLRRRVQSWDTVREWLDRKYDKGYGGAECWSIWAWTENRVIVVHEYDGATSVGWFPRNPTDGSPQFA